jgi:hypothetical protein
MTLPAERQLEPPLVSVMMPAFNAERYISAAIESVLAQTLANWELVIVDDGSTDRTATIVAGYDDARIRLIRQSNRGEAAARNVALDCLRGQFVAFLDADDLYLPRHLATTVDQLQRSQDHVGVYTDGMYITEDGRPLKRLSARRRPPVAGRVFDEVVRGSDLFGPPLCVVLRNEPIRRHALQFDENILIGPDWDFFVQVAAVGTFDYIGEATCSYRVHSTNLTSRTALQRRRLECAKCRTKAIKMAGFVACPLDVRVNVFHDLLVNGLRDVPERQGAVLEWPEFLALPPAERGRLLRLIASAAVLHGTDPASTQDWIRRARAANAWDVRVLVVDLVHRLSPALCRLALRLRRVGQEDPATRHPFADLGFGNEHSLPTHAHRALS